jgi:hypothetical protein
MNQLKRHIGTLLLTWMLSSATSAAAQAADESTAPLNSVAQPDAAAPEHATAQPESAPSRQPSPADADPRQAELLGALFEEAAEGSKTTRKYTGLAGVTGGTILLGLAGWRLAEDPAENQFTRGLGVMFATLGMADLTTGIVALKRKPHEEERAERYKQDLRDGMSAIDLARYEGEFQASADIRESLRMLVRWNGLTHALAGAMVMAFSAIPELDAASQRSAYIIGGVFMATGSASFGLSFRETPAERSWKNYQKQTGNLSGLGQRVGVAPVISRHVLGLGVSGRF